MNKTNAVKYPITQPPKHPILSALGCLGLFLLLGTLTGCTNLHKAILAATPPKDAGVVNLDITGHGVVLHYHRDTSVGGAQTNVGPAVIIEPQTTLKVRTVR